MYVVEDGVIAVCGEKEGRGQDAVLVSNTSVTHMLNVPVIENLATDINQRREIV